jgi:hypothetical protein
MNECELKHGSLSNIWKDVIFPFKLQPLSSALHLLPNTETRSSNSELFQLFKRLKDERHGFREKVLIIEGDCSQPGLGLSPSDRQRVVHHVDIVFHAAATVRFDEKLPVAVATNVAGTRELLLLCHDCPKIKVSELNRNSLTKIFQSSLFLFHIQISTSCSNI